MRQKLCRAANAAEGVFDFVGEVADEFAVGGLLHQQAFFFGDFELLGDRAQLNQGGAACYVNGGDAAQHLQRGLVVGGER